MKTFYDNVKDNDEVGMAKRINVRVFENSNENPNDWFKIDEYEYGTFRELKYGENPQQAAELFKSPQMVNYEVIDGKELSYNEMNNVVEVTNIVSEFYDVNAVAIVQHTMPCGVALGRTIEEAYNKAFDCDPIASFFGTIGFSKKIDVEVAKHINSMAVKVVVAPDFEEEALKLLRTNLFLKIVKLNTPLKHFKSYMHKIVKITPFGTLVQDFNKSELSAQSFRIVTKNKPTKEQIEDGVFAWKVSKYARTNSIVIANNFKTVAVSQGHLNPVAGVEHALNTACDTSKDAVMVLDNTLPTVDGIYAAAQGRISLIIQPGGSAKDSEIIALANKYNIAMIMTGVKNSRS